MRLGSNPELPPDENNEDDLDNSKKRKRFQSAFKAPTAKRQQPPAYDTEENRGHMWGGQDMEDDSDDEEEDFLGDNWLFSHAFHSCLHRNTHTFSLNRLLHNDWFKGKGYKKEDYWKRISISLAVATGKKEYLEVCQTK